ncbi:GIY-YIG nuclease family protein [Leisingera caerulea]|uniref:GIY-YIG nuclease family protein n=1 Tax=Leisingera caerulea TaxID=506591 RepID=A0ABY5WWE6_LEICA|nr:GIY-YIG nuclease family protein [Leisingera caerulea]UWQ58636.1 GIY-YIG nuclease family protein [Leisingera caerulea]
MPVYFISIEGAEFGPIKIGRAKNIERRKRDLQTGNPNPLLLLGYIHSGDEIALEKDLHQQFHGRRRQGEWFDIDVLEILPSLKAAGAMGYLPSDHAAYEFVGNDRDGVPEFARGASWVDLGPEECCPSCGSFCGMWYSDAFSCEICQQCGYTGNDPDRHEVCPC